MTLSSIVLHMTLSSIVLHMTLSSIVLQMTLSSIVLQMTLSSVPSVARALQLKPSGSESMNFHALDKTYWQAIVYLC